MVSNTSPLSNLAIIDRLEVLLAQLGTIEVPPEVRNELDRLTHPGALSRLDAAFQDGWLQVTTLIALVPANVAHGLDPGEAAALALALQTKASLVLLDESAARLRATQLGIPHAGVLGVLRQAKQSGQITSLAVEIRRLRTEARFFIHPALERTLLAAVGE